MKVAYLVVLTINNSSFTDIPICLRMMVVFLWQTKTPEYMETASHGNLIKYDGKLGRERVAEMRSVPSRCHLLTVALRHIGK